MGGTWDATNVADARVAVVTPVAMDHSEYLGPDVTTIAGEKAGIIKRRTSIAVLAHQQPGALDALVRRAIEVDVVVAREGMEFGVLERRVALGGQQVRLQGLGGEYDEVYLPLFGAHQAQNAAVALAAVEAFLGAGAATGPVEQETVRAAFAAVRSPGRLERVRPSPSVLIDAAHNPAGMAATVEAIAESFDFTRLIGVVGVRRRQGRRRDAGRARGRSAPRSWSRRTARRGRCPPTSWARWRSTSSAPTGSASHHGSARRSVRRWSSPRRVRTTRWAAPASWSPAA